MLAGWCGDDGGGLGRWRRLLPAVMLAGWCGVLAGCGGQSPAAPDASALSLTPGLQLLTLGGFAGSVDPAFPPCTPIGQPPSGTSVATLVSLAIEGREWVARSSSGNGTIEVRLRPSASSANGYTVVGTMAGTARDVGLMGVVRDVSVTLRSTGGGAASFDGETTARLSAMVVGRVSGALRFSDSLGASSSCPAIQWSMQPY